MALESIDACPVCANRQFTLLLKATDFTTTGEQFNITQCSQCGLISTNPRPTRASIGKYYESPKYISHTDGSNSVTDRIYRSVRGYATKTKLDLIRRHQASGTMLDYGCGTGAFLEAALKQGWTCTGVEPAIDARKRIAPQIDVHANIQSVKKSFNVITLWHVFEHVHDPNETLQLLTQRLSPGGTIFIAVPNPESFDAKHYREYWAGYDVPRHLWHYTKGSMNRLLTHHKLKIQRVVPMKFDAYYVSLLSESYRRPGKGLLNMTTAFVNGIRSNLKAGNDNYSSLIYIAGS
jgi:2-polyprenyl-3-methyl-5-hydroxy-6-metoxy-1,4-benzoquinol methylase